MRFSILAALIVTGVVTSTAQPVPSSVHPLHRPFDQLLDVYVRDGFVYYNALRIERRGIDAYVASLNSQAAESLAKGSGDEQKAFWINAYNALVLRTVVNAYPIAGKSDGYPAASIGQIPGAFDKTKHRVAGQLLTLDEIEKTVIAGFADPRMLIALGRGALGSGRLRSEAYTGARLNEQLDQAVEEFVKRADVFRIDRALGIVEVTPFFSWREAFFLQPRAAGGDTWALRSPLEQSLIAMAFPHRLPTEREFLAKNTFQMKFGAYDWRLNDLTGGAPIR
jgi:hypothetical protein